MSTEMTSSALLSTLNVDEFFQRATVACHQLDFCHHLTAHPEENLQ